MSDGQKVSITALLMRLKGPAAVLRQYSLVLFVTFVACIYGFVLLRINSLSSLQPPQSAVDTQVKAARIPHIDQDVVNKLESLEDNSVSVQTLFDQARNNPFQ